MKTVLLDCAMKDGSRLFATLPEVCSWEELRRHTKLLDGAAVTNYLTDEVCEMWLDFSFCRQAFSVNNQSGDFWFFVRDPACPDHVLIAVVEHFELLLAP